jgi:hypothetical protein
MNKSSNPLAVPAHVPPRTPLGYFHAPRRRHHCHHIYGLPDWTRVAWEHDIGSPREKAGLPRTTANSWSLSQSFLCFRLLVFFLKETNYKTRFLGPFQAPLTTCDKKNT